MKSALLFYEQHENIRMINAQREKYGRRDARQPDAHHDRRSDTAHRLFALGDFTSLFSAFGEGSGLLKT